MHKSLPTKCVVEILTFQNTCSFLNSNLLFLCICFLPLLLQDGPDNVVTDDIHPIKPPPDFDEVETHSDSAADNWGDSEPNFSLGLKGDPKQIDIRNDRKKKGAELKQVQDDKSDGSESEFSMNSAGKEAAETMEDPMQVKSGREYINSDADGSLLTPRTAVHANERRDVGRDMEDSPWDDSVVSESGKMESGFELQGGDMSVKMAGGDIDVELYVPERDNADDVNDNIEPGGEDEDVQDVKKEQNDEETWTSIEESSLDVKFKPLKMMKAIEIEDGDKQDDKDGENNKCQNNKEQDNGKNKEDETDIGESEFESDFSLSINIKPLKLTKTVDIPIDGDDDDKDDAKEEDNGDRNETDDDLDDLKSIDSMSINIKPLKMIRTVDIPIDYDDGRHDHQDYENGDKNQTDDDLDELESNDDHKSDVDRKRTDEETGDSGEETDFSLDVNIKPLKMKKTVAQEDEEDRDEDSDSTDSDTSRRRDSVIYVQKTKKEEVSIETSVESDEWQAALDTVKRVDLSMKKTEMEENKIGAIQDPAPDQSDIGLTEQMQPEVVALSADIEKSVTSNISSKVESEDEWKAALARVNQDVIDKPDETSYIPDYDEPLKQTKKVRCW